MRNSNAFKAMIFSDDGTSSVVDISLVGETNMFICRSQNGTIRLLSSKDLLVLLGEKKLDFDDASDKEKFVDAMDIAISSSLMITRFFKKAMAAAGIAVGVAASAAAIAVLVSVLRKSYQSS